MTAGHITLAHSLPCSAPSLRRRASSRSTWVKSGPPPHKILPWYHRTKSPNNKVKVPAVDVPPSHSGIWSGATMDARAATGSADLPNILIFFLVSAERTGETIEYLFIDKAPAVISRPRR